MAGVQPLGPAYPAVPARKVGDEAGRQKRRGAKRKAPAPRKRDDGKPGGKIDEYA